MKYSSGNPVRGVSVAGAVFVLSAFSCTSAVSGVVFTEDFSQYVGNGFAPGGGSGRLDSNFWRVTGLSGGDGTFGGTHTDGRFVPESGNVQGGKSSGGVYAFNTLPTVDVIDAILGVQPTGTNFTPGSLQLKLTNNAGAAITDLTVSYDFKVFNNENRSSSFDLALDTNNDGTCETSTTGFSTVTPAAEDNPASWQTSAFSNTITGLNIPVGQSYVLCFESDDSSGSSSRDEFGIDNIVVEDNVADATPPALTSAVIVGDTLTLQFDEDFDPAFGLNQADVSVGINGTPHAVDGIGVHTNSITLRILTTTIPTDVVTVSYSGDTLRDASGNKVAALTNHVVTNNSPNPADNTAPSLQGIAVVGNVITLTYDEPLDDSVTLNAFNFGLVGSAGAFNDNRSAVVTGNQVVLTYATGIPSGVEVSLTYNGLDSVQDANGNKAASFLQTAITNNTPAAPSKLVVNEIHADPHTSAGDANKDGTRDSGDDEFIEFINASGGLLNISGWEISDSSSVRHVVPDGTSLRPGQAFVVFGGGTPTGSFGRAIVQVASSGSLSLSNSGDTIRVHDGVSELLSLAYTNAANDQSINLNPEVTGSAYENHQTLDDFDLKRFSPGQRFTMGDFYDTDVSDPEIISAQLIGFEIRLQYSEPLDATSVPSVGDFSASDSMGGNLTITQVQILQDTLTLTVDRAVNQDATVSVSYVPGVNPAQDLSSTPVAALTNHSVTNLSDSEGPKLLSVIAHNNVLILKYNEDIDFVDPITPTNFIVTGSVSGQLLGSAVQVSNQFVTVTLTGTLQAGESVLFTNENADNSLHDFHSQVDNPAAPIVDLVVGNTTGNTPVINEFLRDHPGSDTNEFVEILGAPDQDLSALSLLIIELDLSSNVGQIDRVVTLGQANKLGFYLEQFNNKIENGTVGFFLVNGFSGAQGDDLDTNNDGVFDATPWTQLLDSVAVTDSSVNGEGLSQSVLMPGFSGSTFELGAASRAVDGLDSNKPSDWIRNDFSGEGVLTGVKDTTAENEAFNTPGESNRHRVPTPDGSDPLTASAPANLEVLTGGSLLISASSVGQRTDRTITAQLSVTEGVLRVNDAVTGGVVPLNMTGNGTSLIHLAGTPAEIDATLQAGVLYQSPNTPGMQVYSLQVSDGLLRQNQASSNIDVTDTPTNLPTQNTVPATVIAGTSGSVSNIGASLSVADGAGPAGQVFSVTLSIGVGIIQVQATAGVEITHNNTGAVTLSSSDLAALNAAIASASAVVGDYVGAVLITMNSSDGVGGSDSDSYVVNFTQGGSETAITIEQVQGTAHRSGVVGHEVTLSGEVTATRTTGDDGFFLQTMTPDADDRTSPAIFVYTVSPPTVAVGNRVTVTGTVSEDIGSSVDLTRTQISFPVIDANDNDTTLDLSPIILGEGGRAIPSEVIDDDNFTQFDIASDGIDFFESLEGAFVTVNNPIAISQRASDGDFFVVADNGANASGFYAERGVLVISGGANNSTFDDDDFNPEKIKVTDSITGISTPSSVSPGDAMGTLTGVMTSAGAGFEMLPTQAIVVNTESSVAKEESTLVGDETHLTIAGMNVENLDPSDAASKFTGLAHTVVQSMNNPDIIGLQEIQDNTGSTQGDGVLSADQTAQLLIDAIAAQAGGATDYAYFDFHPVEGAEGGQPGGNIRVGYLFRTSRVTLALPTQSSGITLVQSAHAGANSTQGTSTLTRRLPDNDSGADTAYDDNGFVQNNAYASTRIPASAQFTFLPTGEAVTVVNVHFSSRGGSDPLFGAIQPPRTNEAKREAQAHVVRDFIESVLRDNAFANIAVLGDFNTFGFSSTVEVLAQSGNAKNLHNLEEGLSPEKRFSFEFDGNGQTLDHLMVSNNMFNHGEPQLDKVHVNVGFDDAASDHDPLMGRFKMNLPVAPTVNQAPVISGSPVTQIFAGETYHFAPTASDPDGDELNFVVSNLPSWMRFNSATGSLSGTPQNSDAGVYSNIRIGVSDGALLTRLTTFSVTVISNNQTPVISGEPSAQVTAGEAYRFVAVASDPDGDALTFSISNLPSWASFSASTGVLSGTPSNTDAGLYSNIVISVSDGSLVANLPAFSIEVRQEVLPLVAQSVSATTAEDNAVQIVAQVAGSGADTAELQVVSQPQNGTLSVVNGGWLYTPAADFNGSDNFSYQAQNGDATSNTAVVSIGVSAVNDAPVARDDALVLSRDETGIYTLSVLDNDTDVDVLTNSDVLSIAAVSADIGQASIVNNRVQLAVESTFVGTVNLSYSVVDSAGDIAQAQVSLTIEGDPVTAAPIVIAPDAVTVNATGLFTQVDLGTATASDSAGNVLPVSLVEPTTRFAPGKHTVHWRAEDASGVSSIAEQSVTVLPLISLSGDQIGTEGQRFSVNVLLNGDAPSYPFDVAYTVSGSAQAGADHSLVDGVVTFTQGRVQPIHFDVFADSETEANETVIMTLTPSQTGLNIVASARSQMTIQEANIAPRSTLQVTQNGQSRLTVSQAQGLVNVNAQVSDLNPQDVLTGQWTSDIENVSDSPWDFQFDPATLATGIHEIALMVFDSGAPVLSNQTAVFVEVVESFAILTNEEDTDGDLIPDAIEGFNDADGDGIPDYLDAINECNVVPQQVNTQDSFLIESDPGVCLRQGTLSAVDGLGGLQVSVEQTGSRTAAVSPSASALPNDEQALNVGGVFDFILYDLPQVGMSVNVVIPQTSPIPANAVYRKFHPDTETWGDFATDADNAVLSATGEEGVCPATTSQSWQEGLVEGAWCVQLRIQDGGPNDDDRLLNGAISDPGGVAVPIVSNALPQAQNDTVVMRWNTTVDIDVLINDTDADGDVLTVTSASASFGAVIIQADSRLTYTPNENFVGEDEIVYVISDGQGGTASATVNVTIEGNRAPVTVNDTASTAFETQVIVDVLANDSDPDGDALTLVEATALSGNVAIQAGNQLRFTPATGFSGEVQVEYSVSDGQATTTGVLIITVEAAPTPPTPPVTPEPPTTDNGSSGGSLHYWFYVWGFMALYRRYRQPVR